MFGQLLEYFSQPNRPQYLYFRFFCSFILFNRFSDRAAAMFVYFGPFLCLFVKFLTDFIRRFWNSNHDWMSSSKMVTNADTKLRDTHGFHTTVFIYKVTNGRLEARVRMYLHKLPCIRTEPESMKLQCSFLDTHPCLHLDVSIPASDCVVILK